MMMKKNFVPILCFICISLFVNTQNTVAAERTIKVLDIETSTIFKEIKTNEEIDKEVENVIRAIKRVTVQANPIPKQGYLIKIPLTKSLKIKNEWFEEIVSEVLIIYNPTTKDLGKIIFYTDENTPMFFDIEYNFAPIFKKLNINKVQTQ